MIITDMQKILIVDDDKSTTESIGTYFEELGYTVLVANNGIDALEMIKRNNPDLVITDVRMPKLGGIELSYILKGMNFKNPLIFISGYDLIDSSIQDINYYAYIKKPIDIFELSNYVVKALNV